MSTDGQIQANPQRQPERVLRNEAAYCAACLKRLTPSRGWQSYCSAACRKDAWKARQHMLDFAPQLSDPRIPADEQPKLRTDVELVLARLEQGPATTAQLAKAAPRSLAIHSRVADVRAMLASSGRTVVKRRLGPRLYEYRIESKEDEG